MMIIFRILLVFTSGVKPRVFTGWFLGKITRLLCLDSEWVPIRSFLLLHGCVRVWYLSLACQNFNKIQYLISFLVIKSRVWGEILCILNSIMTVLRGVDQSS